MKLSVVTTLYCSAPYIEQFLDRTTKAIRELTDDYEIVVVNDGSPDNALDITKKRAEADDHIKVVDLTRNFGHLKAMQTGLAHTKGELVFQIDCDLEDDPASIVEFYRLYHENPDVDVVWGRQLKRKGGFFEQFSGAAFYWLISRLSEHPIQVNHTMSRLMSRRYVESLLSHRDRELFLAGLWVIAGFRQIPFTYQKLSKGSSTYTLRKKLAIVVNSITSFSTRPLVGLFYLGLFIAAASALAAMVVAIRDVTESVVVDGWAYTMISLVLLGGLVVFSIGVVGIYLAKVLSEIRERPFVVVKHIYDPSLKESSPSQNAALAGIRRIYNYDPTLSRSKAV